MSAVADPTSTTPSLRFRTRYRDAVWTSRLKPLERLVALEGQLATAYAGVIP